MQHRYKVISADFNGCVSHFYWHDVCADNKSLYLSSFLIKLNKTMMKKEIALPCRQMRLHANTVVCFYE